MPYDIEEQRRADSLTRGARVVLNDVDDGWPSPLVVQHAERKIRYTYLTFGVTIDGEPRLENVKYSNEAKLTVLREKLTEAEMLVRDYERALHWSQRELTEALANQPADMLVKYAEEWRDSTYKGHVLDWSNGTTFFKIQAKYKMWRTVQHTFDRLRELYGDDVSVLSAIAVELDNRDRERLDYRPDDPTSRSTNVLSNLIDSLDRWAWETLSDTARYQLSSEVREQEMTRLRQLADARKATLPSAVDAVTAR
jgi:hypothetical protein